MDRDGPRPRVLFLGDSYTEGSGSAAACNYPEVATDALGRIWNRPVHLLNAGVAGYGPQDALRLMGFLLDEGYRFDAVVFSLFLENDLTDDLPKTTRRVVAGTNFRFPESAFLRRFHPLNSRAFRYAVFFERTRGLLHGGAEAVHRGEGTCRLEPRRTDAEVPAELEALVQRRLATSYGAAPRVAVDLVLEAVQGMQQRSAAAGVPFALAVFPDRLRVDGVLGDRLGIPPEARPDDRWVDRLRTRFPSLIDASPALVGGAENYRPDDTHLNDLGNVRAGRFGGRALAERLAPLPAR